MNQLALTIFFSISLVFVIALSLSVIYLVIVYRRLLDKYTNLLVDEGKNEAVNKIRLEASRFVDNKIDYEIAKVGREAVDLISKNTQDLASEIRQKTLSKLEEKEKEEENSVKTEFDEAKREIENYKKEKIEEVRINANKILSSVLEEVGARSLSNEEKEALIIRALENAKQNQLF